MSHFYGWMKGSRGETTRCGTKNSGIKLTAHGWDLGATVQMFQEDGEDVALVYLTTGSTGNGPNVFLGLSLIHI